MKVCYIAQFAFIFEVDVPVAVFYEDCYVLVAEVPAYVVIIIFVFGCFNGQGKIPTAQAGALVT